MYGIGDTCRLDIYGRPVEESTNITQKVNAIIQVFMAIFPAPVTALTVSYVGEDYLETMAQMKEWQEVAGNPELWRQYNLEKISPCFLRVLDEAVWKEQNVDLKKFGLSFSGMGQIDYRRCIRIMKKCVDKIEHRIGCGLVLISMPKGLSSKTVREIFGWKLFYTTFHEEAEINEPYTVLVAQDLLRDSKGKSFEDCVIMAKELECEEPLHLEMLVLSNLGNHRFDGWTICKEKFDGKCTVRNDPIRCYVSYTGDNAVSNIGIAPRALVSLSSSLQGS